LKQARVHVGEEVFGRPFEAEGVVLVGLWERDVSGGLWRDEEGGREEAREVGEGDRGTGERR